MFSSMNSAYGINIEVLNFAFNKAKGTENMNKTFDKCTMHGLREF